LRTAAGTYIGAGTRSIAEGRSKVRKVRIPTGSCDPTNDRIAQKAVVACSTLGGAEGLQRRRTGAGFMSGINRPFGLLLVHDRGPRQAITHAHHDVYA
jgi:hypothetical protein